MKTYIAIVIDQLAWRDRGFFADLDRLLPVGPRGLKVPYFPTVTETAHATFSTGFPPSQHGVIGAETISGDPSGYRTRLYDEAALHSAPLVATLAARGVQTFIIAGKPKVASLMDPRLSADRRGPGIRVTWEIGEDRTPVLSMLDEDGGKGDADWGLEAIQYPSRQDEGSADEVLFEVADRLLAHARDRSRQAFLFLGLSYTDKLGHRAGHSSPHFQQHLDRLNRRLLAFNARWGNADPETCIVVLSDHGCRDVDTVIWPSAKFNGRKIRSNIHELDERLELPLEHLLRCQGTGGQKPAVLYDGGLMRLWTKPGSEEIVRSCLTKGLWRVVIDRAFRSEALPDQVADIGERAHPNMGHVIAIARPKVALCKESWIHADASGFVVPKGEHGTDFNEDKAVPVWGPFDTKAAFATNICQYFR